MKTCSNCKTINEDDAKFCKSCGCTQFLQHNSLKWHSKNPEVKAETTWSAIDIVKKYGSSDLLSWMSILFILLAFFEIITSINSLLYIREIYREYSEQNIHQFDQFLSSMSILVVASMVLTFAVNFAIWSGMLKFRESSKIFSNERFNIKGLKIIRVSLIVSLVFSGLFILCCIILLNSLNSMPSVVNNVLPVYGFEENGSIVLIISLVFEAVYSILLINTVSSVINTVKTGIPSGYVSMFIIVVNFINAIIYLLSIFASKNTQEGILSKIYAAGFVAFFIIFSILLLQYRAEINAYKESFSFENPYLGENKT